MEENDIAELSIGAADAAIRLMQARENKGLTQQQVATVLGIELCSYQRYESGESQLATASYKTCISICKLLNIEPFDLLRPLSEQLDAPHIGFDSQLHDKSQEVFDILIELGIPAHIKGYQYLKEAILLAMKDTECSAGLYAQVAERFVTTESSVERAIRHAIEFAYDRNNWTELEWMGNFKDKPTNIEFIDITSSFLRNRNSSNQK